MKDLFFMNDGNATTIGNGMVNFQKFRTIMAKILALRVSQQSVYQFSIGEGAARAPGAAPAPASQHSRGTGIGGAVRMAVLVAYCETLYAKEEDVLTEASRVLEPPKMQRQTSAASFNSQVSGSTANSDEHGDAGPSAAPPAGEG
jgi:hypothetical protein